MFTPSSIRDITLAFPHSLSTTQYRVNDCEVSSNKCTLIMLTYVVTYCIPTAVPPRTSKVMSTSRLIQPHFITAHTSTDRIHELSLTVNSLCCKPIVTPAEKHLHTIHYKYEASKPLELCNLTTPTPIPPTLSSRVYKCTLISVFWAVGFETALRSNFSHSKQICACNYTHKLANDLSIQWLVFKFI